MAYSQMGTIPWGAGRGGAENAERGRIKSSPQADRIWLWQIIRRSPYAPCSIYLGGTTCIHSN